MSHLIIRKMQIGDHIGLKKNVYPTMDMAQIEENVKNNAKEMQNDGSWVYLVADLGSEIVGTTYIKFCESSIGKHVAEIFSVVVSPNHLKKGICRAMIDKAISTAKEKGIEIIKLTVREDTVADTMYQKLGFKDYGILKNGIKDNGKYFNEKLYYLNIG